MWRSLLAACILTATAFGATVDGRALNSATGAGIAGLFDQIDAVLAFDTIETVTFRIPMGEGAAIAMLHACGRVLREDYDGDSCQILVQAPESLRRRLKRYLTAPAEGSTGAVENSVKK